MTFLSNELEQLLQTCIENDSDFPKILQTMLNESNFLEESRLRSQIKSLVDEGFLSKIIWGDNLPLIGRIEQKGYDYFKQRDSYIRAKLRQDPQFALLDDESEKTLKNLIDTSEEFIQLCGNASEGKVYENLADKGYIKIYSNGLSYTFSGEFVGVASVTQRGKQYFKDKEQRIEEILLLQNENSNIPVYKKDKLFDVFISHANNDKTDYVNKLKDSLDKLKINIFYDKDTLEWGDDWKSRILNGVQNSEFAIIIISDNFFDREWTEKELNEFLNRQNANGQKIILPILYNITIEQLKAKYPVVSDIQVLNSKDYSCDEIALKFAAQLIKRLKR